MSKIKIFSLGGLDESGKNIYDGIKSLNIIDWLLNK